MAIKNTVVAIPMTAFDTSGIMATYLPVNAPGGLTAPCFIVSLVNDSNIDITVSYDGTTDHEYVIAQTRLQIPVNSGAQPASYIANFAKGTIVYVKAAAPGIGNLFLTGYAHKP